MPPRIAQDGPRIDLEGSGRVKYRPDRGERPRGQESDQDCSGESNSKTCQMNMPDCCCTVLKYLHLSIS